MRKGFFATTALAAVGAAALAASPAHAIPTIQAQLAARTAPAVASTSNVGFDVFLPLRNKAQLSELLAAQQSPGSPQFHKWLTPAQFAERFGPTRLQMARIASDLRARGLSVEMHTRALHVSGSAADINRALSTTLVTAQLPSGVRHTVASRAITLPASIAAAGGIVVSFSQHLHEAHTMARNVGQIDPANRNSATGTYWYNDLKQAYQYPSYNTMVTTPSGKTQRLDGTGTTIALLMSSDALDSDVAAMFNHEGWSTVTGKPNPTLYKHIAVNGGCAIAGAPQACGAFDESSLDVQMAITGAPGARVELYNIPSLSDDNIIAGYQQIVDDNEADVISSSFGGCELYYTADYNSGTDYTYLLTLESELYMQGNAQGQTFLASSGDNAGLQCPSKSYVLDGQAGTFQAGVSVPAADPNVTAVGGTNLVTTFTTKGALESAYVGENAWSDPLVPYDVYGFGTTVSGGYWGAGGGVSTIFPRPVYQTVVSMGSEHFRAVPDIGMMVGGCPGGISVTPCNGGNQPINGNGNTQRSAVAVAIGGKFYGLIGTSVASPEGASAVALAIEHYGRQGNINTWLYYFSALQFMNGENPKSPYTVYHHGIQGYNGIVANSAPFQANYNYTTGNGTPIVFRLVGVPDAAVAGTPRSASNP